MSRPLSEKDYANLHNWHKYSIPNENDPLYFGEWLDQNHERTLVAVYPGMELEAQRSGAKRWFEPTLFKE